MTGPLHVGLASWIIQDANYGDFTRGQSYPFALEFYPIGPLGVRHQNAIGAPPAMRRLEASTYEIEGSVAHVAPSGWWVLDAGLQFYTEHLPAPGPQGTLLSGKVDIGVDHFGYFERYAGERDAPPLIHDWRIEHIERDDAPFVETKPRFFERDRSRQVWMSVQHTNAWEDSKGWGAYILACTRLSDEPRRVR